MGGAIIGALAGGCSAWLLARRNSNEILRRDQEKRTEDQKAAAFRVFVKLLTIINSIKSLHDHIHDALASGKDPSRSHMEPWMLVRPMVGFADEGDTRIDPDEFAVFFAAGDRQFLHDLMLLDRRHASAYASFQAYCERREAFVAVAPTPDSFKGDLGGASLTREQVMRLRMYTIPLNNIIEALAPALVEDWKSAKSLALRFGPLVQSYFKDPEFVALVVPEE
jgi:hypothetical protein